MDIKEVRRLLVANNRWVQGAYGGVLLSTIGNCTEQGLAAEQRRGWKLVAVFHGDQMKAEVSVKGSPNQAVFERPLPAFYAVPNPWHDGPGWEWLPQLALPKQERAVIEFLGAGGHGSAFVVRSFHCRCGRVGVRVFQDEERERDVVVCAGCGRVSHAFSFRPFALPEPQSLEHEPWIKVQCPCGGDEHTLHYGLEYSPDSRSGSDFTWIALAAECIKCGRFAEIYSNEIQ